MTNSQLKLKKVKYVKQFTSLSGHEFKLISDLFRPHDSVLLISLFNDRIGFLPLIGR
jgi:hypothetical protein